MVSKVEPFFAGRFHKSILPQNLSKFYKKIEGDSGSPSWNCYCDGMSSDVELACLDSIRERLPLRFGVLLRLRRLRGLRMLHENVTVSRPRHRDAVRNRIDVAERRFPKFAILRHTHHAPPSRVVG